MSDVTSSLQGQFYSPRGLRKLLPGSRDRFQQVQKRMLEAIPPSASEPDKLDAALSAQPIQTKEDFRISLAAAEASLEAFREDHAEAVSLLQQLKHGHPAERLRDLRLGIRYLSQESPTLEGLKSTLQGEGDRARYADLEADPRPDLTDTWWQGKTRNCVTVACLKAALHEYGTGLFDECAYLADGGAAVQLHDGATVTVSAEETRRALRAAKLEGDPAPVVSLGLAVIAKRKGRDFEEALQSLNEGSQPQKVFQLLGMDHQVYRISPHAVPEHSSVVASVYGHSFSVEQGVADQFGRERPYDPDNFLGYCVTEAYALAPRQTFAGAGGKADPATGTSRAPSSRGIAQS